MKTQLLHDFAESGSAPGDAGLQPEPAPSMPVAVPAAAPVSASGAAPTQPAPARRRPVADLLLQRATDAAQFDAARSRQRTPVGSTASAEPAPDLAAPDLAAPDLAAPDAAHANAGPAEPFFSAAPEAAAADSDTVATPDPLPAWLDERLRADQQRDAGRERRGRWMRRALAVGATAALLALLAGAGWWVIQDNRVDGALTAVANTSAPARSAPPLERAGAGTQAGAGRQAEAGAQRGTGALAGARDGAGPAAQSAPAPVDVPPAAVESAESAQPGADGQLSSSAPTAAAPSQNADPARRAVRKRQAAAVGSASAPGRVKAGDEADDEAGDDAGADHRREETLLQCRALGYDEGQCLRRGCAMTRFGLACRG